jgi:hypothetical protein
METSSIKFSPTADGPVQDGTLSHRAGSRVPEEASVALPVKVAGAGELKAPEMSAEIDAFPPTCRC